MSEYPKTTDEINEYPKPSDSLDGWATAVNTMALSRCSVEDFCKRSINFWSCHDANCED